MGWQLTPTMVRRGAMHNACPPVTGHRQIVPAMQCDGRLARWPAWGFARGTTPIAARGIISGPVHRPTTQLDVRPRKGVFWELGASHRVDARATPT